MANKALPLLLLGGVALFALGGKKKESQILESGRFTNSDVQYRIKERKAPRPNICIEVKFSKWISLKDDDEIILFSSPGEAMDILAKIEAGDIVIEEATGNLTDISNA